MQSNISFTSRIHFITPEQLSKIAKGEMVTYKPVPACTDAYSYSIRTCTGGGVVDRTKQQIKPFHILDCKDNFEQSDKVAKMLFNNAENKQGLLVGSNDLKGSDYSKSIFQKIKEKFLEKTNKVSIFEEHRYPYSETDYFYNGKEDTWFLSAIYKRPTEVFPHEVTTLNDLKNCYKKIQIADNDSLYINGQEISKKI